MPCIPWAGDTGVLPGQGVGTNLVVRPLGRVPGALCTPCHPLPSPPQGLGQASLTYFRPAGDKGGLSSSAQAEKGWEVAAGGGHGQSAGPPHPWPYSLGNPQGLETGETLPRRSACSEVPISPHTWLRERPEQRLQGTDWDPPLANLSSSCKGRSRTSSQTPHELPGVTPRVPQGCPRGQFPRAVPPSFLGLVLTPFSKLSLAVLGHFHTSQGCPTHP